MPSNALDREPEFVVGDPVPNDRPSVGRGTRPRKSIRSPIGLLLIFGVVAGAASLYFFRSNVNAPPPAPVAMTTEAPLVAPQTPEIRYPVERIAGASEATQPQLTLPPLDDSDAQARDSIAAIQNGDTWISLLVPGGIVRHLVATVDALPQKTLAVQARPVISAPGPFQTTISSGGMAIAADNASRYAPYVSAAEAIDSTRLAGFYVRFYPMLQQAYVELGYPKGYFNDRVIATIDHLIAAPEPHAPVYLTQPRVVYEFADPILENLSAGQKIMVRMGLDNERRIKAKLRDVRAKLAVEPLAR
ncbi:MAG: DUF3014 domain-containing protein [Casimicrobiaceae bacterium]